MSKVQGTGYTVYKHTTPSGKVYIGITSIDPERRWLNGRGYQRNEHFYRAIKQYGWNNITHEIIETGMLATDACNLEQRLIAQYNATDQNYGYNHTSGGEHYKASPETIEKQRKAQTGKHYNIGIKFTEERKQHLREHHYDCRGANNPNYGKKWTPEQIAVRQAHRVYARGSDNPTAKAILQYDKDGNLVKRWGSIAEATQVCNRTSIKDCLRGKYKSACGYIWKYEEAKQCR